jgi:hypothetical protein
MDADRFDRFVRSLLLAPSRRHLLAGLASGLLALTHRVPIEGKKKRKKHKKKKKRATCTPACAGKSCGDNGCGGSCGSCDADQVCQNGACVDDCSRDCTGKECGDDGCGGSCGGCGPQQTCQDGECICNDFLVKCGEFCIEGQQCCTDDECPGITACIFFGCRCPDEGDILCSAESCCEPGAEVCPWDRSHPQTGSCQAGGCPASNVCNSETIYRCAPECGCLTSVDGATVCTAAEADECVPCSHDVDCTTALGQPAVCIANGPHCGCAGLSAFCVTADCPALSARQVGTRHTRSLVGGLTDNEQAVLSTHATRRLADKPARG